MTIETDLSGIIVTIGRLQLLLDPGQAWWILGGHVLARVTVGRC
jgi:hypothetical protein